MRIHPRRRPVPPPDQGRYLVVKTYGGLGRLEHLDGLPWNEVPALPPRRHRCHAQTRLVSGRESYEMCPCGAQRVDSRGRWVNRNTRIPPNAASLARAAQERTWNELTEAFSQASAAGDHVAAGRIRGQAAALAAAMEPGSSG